MTYDDLVLNDRELLEVFDVARRERALVMVHAEGYDAIKFMTERLEREGKTAPYYHAVSRPEIVEREAAHRAISHAELVDVPIMIVHVSGREAMEQIRWAQSRGLKIYAETCPQYITLTAEDLQGLNMDMSGAKYVCSPPPRDAESQAAIWEGLQLGRVPDLLVGPLPVPLRQPAGQADAQRAHLVPLGAERHPGNRDAAADPVLGRRLEGAHLAATVRRADIDQPRQAVRALPEEGLDRHRLRRRHHLVGSERGRRPSARTSCITAPTTRPGRVSR